MSFNESIKLQIKRQAAFQCCRCHDIGVEAHHIIPESEKGSDEIDNGAPLCPSCHSNFGGNPDKRKEIRQMRDFWYDVVKEKHYKSHDLEMLEELNNKLFSIKEENHTITAEVAELKKLIDDLKKQNEIKDGDSAQVIRHKTSQFISATTLANNVHTNFQCRKCGTLIGLLIGSNTCPTCKEPI